MASATKDTKSSSKAYEPTVEERLDRIERSIGLHGPYEVEVPAAPKAPDPQALYAPGSEEEEAAEAERQEAATKAAESK